MESTTIKREYSITAIILLVIAIIAYIILALTNPKEEMHQTAFMDEFNAEVGRMMQKCPDLDERLKLNVAVSSITLGLKMGMGSPAYNNYGVCSTLTYNGETLTFGILGKVTVSDDVIASYGLNASPCNAPSR